MNGALWGFALIGLAAACLGLVLVIVEDHDGIPHWLRQDTIDDEDRP